MSPSTHCTTALDLRQVGDSAEKFLLPFINWRVIDAGLGSQICHSRLFDLERDPLRNLSLTALFADVQPCVGFGEDYTKSYVQCTVNCLSSDTSHVWGIEG